ncbi:MAG: ABC transporter permease [Candidatus Acidiferrales bacterium]
MYASLRAALSRIRDTFSPHRIEGNSEFDRELESHLELLTDENIRRGMTPVEARRAAHLRLGDQSQLRETNRELRGLPFLETLEQDVRYALRMLRKNPGFTAVTVLTLALGIGANTAIFSVVYAVMLKPLPYPRPGELYNVSQYPVSQKGTKIGGWSYLNLEDLRRDNNIFTAVAGNNSHQLTLTGRGEPAMMNASVVTGEFFTVFDQQPLLGRVLTQGDAKIGAAPVVVLSENLWRGVFHGDPNIVGQSINLDKKEFAVVGVMPSRFRFPLLTESDQLWVPLPQDPLFGKWIDRRGGHWLAVTARLKPAVSMAEAQAELDGIASRLAKENPAENRDWLISMAPLQTVMTGDVRVALFALLAAVGLVLLIACANIANLLLTRATSRAREIAVRATLGAGRARIVRQLLSETAVLGLLGGIAGLALAYWGVTVLSAMLPASVPRANAIRVDHFVLGFALVLSLLASVGFGLAPALFAMHTDLQSNLREGTGRSGESGGRRRMRNVLAAAEIALATVLLVGAGLFLRSFSRMMSTDPGFQAENVVKADVSLPRFEYSTPEKWSAFATQLMTTVQSEPGMQNSAIAVPMPITDGFVNLGFEIVGAPPPSPGALQTADYAAISPNYFRVMAIPLLAGRTFSEHDTMSAPRVTLISKTLAQRYFPNEDPIGKQLSFSFPPDPGTSREIVGVVGDVRDVALDRTPGPMMYVPFAQAPLPGAGVIVRSSMSTANVAAAVRRCVAKIDKDLPVDDVKKMPEELEQSVAQPRFRTLLLGLFAAMALVLAATGIFGVISYSVSCRAHDIGIRVALGASRTSILRMILRETLLLAIAGLALGVPCALAASHLIAHLLFDVSANDALTLASVGFILAIVAAVAGYIPARRAMEVDPMLALRHE